MPTLQVGIPKYAQNTQLPSRWSRQGLAFHTNNPLNPEITKAEKTFYILLKVVKSQREQTFQTVSKVKGKKAVEQKSILKSWGNNSLRPIPTRKQKKKASYAHLSHSGRIPG